MYPFEYHSIFWIIWNLFNSFSKTIYLILNQTMSPNQPLFFYRTLRTFFTHKNHSNHIAIFIFQSNLWASSQIFFELALQRNLSISIKSSSSLVAETNTPGEIHKIFWLYSKWLFEKNKKTSKFMNYYLNKMLDFR